MKYCYHKYSLDQTQRLKRTTEVHFFMDEWLTCNILMRIIRIKINYYEEFKKDIIFIFRYYRRLYYLYVCLNRLF